MSGQDAALVTKLLAEAVPMRWCRFCKAETRQLIHPNNEHDRACCVCWRRQGDGEKLVVADGDRRETQAPPPRPTSYYARASDLEELTRRVEALERRGASFYKPTLYK